MMKYLLLTLMITSLTLLSQETQENRIAKKFNIPVREFIPSGFKISISGSPESSQTHSPGPRHPFTGFLFAALRSPAQFNLGGGQLQRDNVLTENIENYSYFKQPYEKVSPIGKIGTSYTTKLSEWTFDISFRSQNFSGSYVLGNNLPFEYYPGKMEYHWREGQYSIIRNHPLMNMIMIQPQIGIREINETYTRKSDIVSYPIGKNYSSVNEKTKSYSQQAGLSFHFKILESLRIKLTGKIFQGLGGGSIHTERTDARYDGTNYYIRDIRSKQSSVNTYGNELEGEISYVLKSFNFFLGYNLTEISKEATRDPNYFPSIVTNENLGNEYLRYAIANSIYETKDSSGLFIPRYQHIKYLYFGVSVNF